MTIIKKCTCKHEFQDKVYGKGMRVHNKSDKDPVCYCTVCCESNRRNKHISPRPFRKGGKKI